MAREPLGRPYGADPAASRGGDAIRFVAVPLAVTLLFAGGVYWLKQSAPGRPARPSGAVVQVALLAEPAAIQLPPAAPQASASPFDRPTDRPTPQPDPPRPEAVAPTPVTPDTPAVVAQAAAPLAAAVALAPAPPDLLLDSVTAQFRRALSERLARFRRYPAEARRRGAQGAAIVRFTIGRDGSVAAVTLAASSGDAALDREAVATVLRAQPLPGIPAGLPDRMALTIPVNFSLR